MYPKCSGEFQSPIDIDLGRTHVSKSLGHLELTGYGRELKGASVVNNGHTVQCSSDSDISIEGAGLTNAYKFEQFHLHWGQADLTGSEHTIDNKSFPLELHVVHYNTKYASFGKAVGKPEGLAVVGVLFEVRKKDNPILAPLIKAIEQAVRPGGERVRVQGLKLKSLLPESLSPYYRYSGSLTTPPCSEGVVWTLLADRPYIGAEQLERLRQLENDDGQSMAPNYRPVQPLNGRKVEVGSAANICLNIWMFALMAALTLEKFA
ncbi:CA14 [Cordylochernes scorpioides]|uniref:Carbonic anhydrase n=1 Tax=Cordylochernes scorpioides TaxID=51811 RepID=A0ABY6LDN1_9ARAC|nr:CA14 [Cordylochernes scorpioides]